MYFASHDGTRIAYEDYGRGEPIVFVAGAMLPADMWEYQIPHFTDRGYRCVALDRRGHGRSDRPCDGYGIDSTADDLAALLAHLDLTGVTLVGHSMGGAEIARCLARHGEDRVARAAFLSSTLPFLKQTEDNPQGMPQAAFDRLRAAVRADRPKWLARQTQLYFTTHLGSDVSPEQMDVTYRQCLSTAPWALLKAQEACFHADNRADLRGIGVPTLVVHGDADFSAPVERTGRRTAELLREVTYLEYPAAGHGIYVSHARRFNADLLTFLAG